MAEIPPRNINGPRIPDLRRKSAGPARPSSSRNGDGPARRSDGFVRKPGGAQRGSDPRKPVGRTPWVDREPKLLEADEVGPAAVVNHKAADKLRAGHLWVYRTDVEELIPALGAVAMPAGGLITLMDARRIPFGSAIYSEASLIAARKVSAEPKIHRGEYLEDVVTRVRAALALRTPMLADGSTDAVRLIFSEADDLPGIVADRYRNLVILQLLTQGTAQDDMREVLARELAVDGVDVIIERPDPRIRELEKLPAPSTEPLFVREGHAGPPKTEFTLNGLKLGFDANAGQKTGAFLDQRMNYAAAASYAHGEALDICTYQGGFALHMARVCTHVTGVDASRSALETAEANLERNRAQINAQVEWIEADAFELLRAYDTEKRQFDTIVLDPPAFAKTKRAAEGAMRGYKEMNLRALRMLRPGGTLITCSCSHHVSREEFTATVAEAAADAGQHVRMLETRGAALDHPEVLTLPETAYLKCLILRVD
ncbi:SAM-dependent methyltransferase [Terriglobus roseus]|uniref:SAM-dependent methyltransferase n=1 Tax=Terriglobus roseus TaxID=392734 RepID=A0A1H4NRD6_9BACT|nr:SAM-dependent methyltransferase [Terriglobus roseus]